MNCSRSTVLVFAAGVAVAVFSAGCSSSSTGDAAAAGGGRGGRGGRGGGRGGPQPVVVAKATKKDVPVDIAAVGNVEAYTLISVRSQVTGQGRFPPETREPPDGSALPAIAASVPERHKP